MNRYFLEPLFWQEKVMVLNGDEAKHCSRVMRAKAGDQIEIFDGSGRSALTEILTISKSEVVCKLLSETLYQRAECSISLCQSIPKGGNMELIVQKSVELGVFEIQPLITAHTVARPDSLGKKQAKWQRIALEACKQCGQNFLPEVKEPKLFSEWIAEYVFELGVIASLDNQAVYMKDFFEKAAPQSGISLLVGPEGDFSKAEYEIAYEAGFSPVTFGDIIMRVETAAMYGLSVLQHEILGRAKR